MKRINCLVVDDEPIARDIVVDYIAQIPYLHLTDTCEDAFSAMESLKEESVDLLFLDINMPGLTGLGMLRSLKSAPEVIITSAYSEYALEGFELSVTDYLLKPFSFERFVQATEKIMGKTQNNQPIAEKSTDTEDYLFVKSDKRFVKLNINEIQYVEAYGNYINIFLNESKVISKQTLSQFESQLPDRKFIRIHKSYIASIKQINYLEGNRLLVGKKLLPVGKVYREQLLCFFSKP